MRPLRFAAGLVPGILLWLWISPPLTRFLAWATEPLVRIDSRFSDAELNASGTTLAMRGGGTTPSTSFPVAQLSYPMILLVALFASNPRPWHRRNLAAALISLTLFLLLQPLALLVTVESSYAVFSGGWGEQHYGRWAANLWLFLEMFWRLIGMFGLVFACWWLARGSEKEREIE